MWTAHGPELKSDRDPHEPDRNCRPFTCQTAAGNFERNRAEAIADGLKEGEMTDPSTHLARYLVRQGITGWMVWDRRARGPGKN
jgi:hypothetical protein